MFRYAGLVIIGSGFFDLVDGRVARASNQVTRFGGFFDSVIDRYSDASQFFGLLVFYSRGDRFFYVVLTAFVMVSAIMVSYTRARAESLIGSCRVGFMERPERLVLVIIGALFNRMAPVLVADRGAVHDHGNPPHPLHLDANRRRRRASRQGRPGSIGRRRTDLTRQTGTVGSFELLGMYQR